MATNKWQTMVWQDVPVSEGAKYERKMIKELME